MDPKLAEVLEKYEPQLRAAIEAMLAKVKSSASLAQIEAYIVQGDLSGLVGYVQKLYAAAAPEMIAVLSAIVAAAGTAAEADIRSAAAKAARENRRLAAAGLRLMPVPIGSPQMPASAAGITFYGEGKTEDSPGYRFNPINPKTIAATRTWQGNLIQQMTLTAREGIMAQVREGLLAGENPRTTARKIRVGLPLTASQQGHVASFADDIDRIVADGINSAQSWGIYTPKQIKAIETAAAADIPRGLTSEGRAKAIADRAAAQQRLKFLAFTETERKNGRKYGKISRAGGGQGGLGPIGPQGAGKTFAGQPYMDANGVMRTRTHAAIQQGENAFRVIPGTDIPADYVTRWRLRVRGKPPFSANDLDRTIYDIVRAKEDGDVVAEQAAKKRLATFRDKHVADYQGRYTKHRAMVIARTEALRAANLGSYEAWRQALEDNDLFEPGQVKRKWINSQDDRVRNAHREYPRRKENVGENGKGIPINQPFLTENGLQLFPPFGVSCRCSCTYSVDLTSG